MNLQFIYPQQQRCSEQIELKPGLNYIDRQFESAIILKKVELKNDRIPLNSFALFNSDTTFTKIIETNTGHKNQLGLTIMKEIGLGTLMGGLFSVPGGLIGVSLYKEKDLGAIAYGLLGMYSGYLIGSSLGIYLAAKKEKPDVSFWGIFCSELLGSAIGISSLSISKQSGIAGISVIVIPLLAGIIYAELIE
jgi:hypothetical protein